MFPPHIFTYSGSLVLGWSDARKTHKLIKNIEQGSLKIIENSSLKLPSVENITERKSGQLVLTIFKIMFTLPLSYLKHWIILRLQETMVHLEFGKKRSFYYQQYEGAKVFNALPIELLSLTSGILFKKVIK